MTKPSLRKIFVDFNKGDDIFLETHCEYSLLTFISVILLSIWIMANTKLNQEILLGTRTKLQKLTGL